MKIIPAILFAVVILFASPLYARDVTQFDNPNSPSIGNPGGRVVIYQFFDYNCGYCKKSFPDLQALLQEDSNLKIILKDMPILSESSMLAAQYALAAQNQGMYVEYHTALMNNRQQISQELLEQVGTDLGLDIDQLRADAQSPEITQSLQMNGQLFQSIGFSGGVPSFVIGNMPLQSGYYDIDQMRKFIKDYKDTID